LLSLVRPLFVSVRSILNFIWQDFVRFYVLIIFKREKCLFGTWANSILYIYVSKQPNIILFQVNFYLSGFSELSNQHFHTECILQRNRMHKIHVWPIRSINLLMCFLWPRIHGPKSWSARTKADHGPRNVSKHGQKRTANHWNKNRNPKYNRPFIHRNW